MKKAIRTLISTTFLNFLIATSVFAASENISINITPGNEFNSLNNLTIPNMVSGIIRLLLVIAALVFFIMLVIGGIQWIMSGGDKAQSENARKRITSALVGLAIVFSAWAISRLVETLFGVNILNVSLPKFVNQ